MRRLTSGSIHNNNPGGKAAVSEALQQMLELAVCDFCCCAATKSEVIPFLYCVPGRQMVEVEDMVDCSGVRHIYHITLVGV